MKARNLSLWTEEPLLIDYGAITGPKDEERAWEEAVYPIGNGRLGCTAFGVPECERIQFNQESFWVGNEDNTGAYQPFGDIYVETGHHEFAKYRRELDISRAIQTITYTSGGVRYTREYYASAPAGVLVLQFSADASGALSGRVALGNVHGFPIAIDRSDLVLKGNTGGCWYWGLLMRERDRLIANREYSSSENIDLDFEARVRVLHEGGALEVEPEGVRFTDCDTLTLIVAAETNYLPNRSKGWSGTDPHEKVIALLGAAEARTVNDLRKEHVDDYRAIFGRMHVDLGNSPDERTRLPTPERVATYATEMKASGQAKDPELESLLYQYARYLMISSSRGGLPANLQGLWLIAKHPPWRCDYHTDINIQMNYWFTSASNLLECFAPLAHWIDSIREVRKEETRRVLGVERGWLMRSENGIFGGSTWHFQKGDSAWLCQNLWDHYSFARDREYLERYAYPVMKEISEFWVDHLIEIADPEPGSEPGRTVLVAPDGRSPEHGPVGVDGVTYDQVLCWDLFTNTIEASEILDTDAGFREELTEKRDKLLSPRVGRWGQLREWLDDIDDPKDDHRHLSHLICVYPGRQVHPAITPALAEAARVGITARRDHGAGHPGWSKVWKACIFARLLDGESAYTEIAETLAGRVHQNLWAVHPPFQIDCNFGYAAGVNEMLVQSHLGQVELLPAIPEAWNDGHVAGLRVRGGYEIDLDWTGGTLQKATLRGAVVDPAPIEVRYNGRSCRVALGRGESVELGLSDFALSPP